MEKCKTDQLKDGDGQMPNAENNDQVKNAAENAGDQMPPNGRIAPIEAVAKPQKLYKCRKCPAKINHASKINFKHEEIHNRRGNPAYPINCPYCDASFDNKNSFSAHKRVHGVKTQPKAKVGRGPGRPKGSTKRNRPHQANNNDGAEGPQPNNDGAENPQANNNDGAQDPQANNDGAQDPQANNDGAQDPQANNDGAQDPQANNDGAQDPQANNDGAQDPQANNDGAQDPQANNNDGAQDPQANNDGAQDPQANNDGSVEDDDDLEIIEPIKQEPRPHVPRANMAQNAAGPGPSSAGPSAISTIMKECAKSNGCKPGPSSSR